MHMPPSGAPLEEELPLELLKLPDEVLEELVPDELDELLDELPFAPDEVELLVPEVEPPDDEPPEVLEDSPELLLEPLGVPDEGAVVPSEEQATARTNVTRPAETKIRAFITEPRKADCHNAQACKGCRTPPYVARSRIRRKPKSTRRKVGKRQRKNRQWLDSAAEAYKEDR
jgi:hypothetical protein